MYLYTVVHILGLEVHLWSVAILLQASHFDFVLPTTIPYAPPFCGCGGGVLGTFHLGYIDFFTDPGLLGLELSIDGASCLRSRSPCTYWTRWFFFLCTALGLILFAPRLKMMLCVCGSCCVLDVGCSYLDAFGKLKQRKPCRGRALVDEIHVDDVCDVL